MIGCCRSKLHITSHRRIARLPVLCRWKSQLRRHYLWSQRYESKGVSQIGILRSSCACHVLKVCLCCAEGVFVCFPTSDPKQIDMCSRCAEGVLMCFPTSDPKRIDSLGHPTMSQLEKSLRMKKVVVCYSFMKSINKLLLKILCNNIHFLPQLVCSLPRYCYPPTAISFHPDSNDVIVAYVDLQVRKS